MAPKKKKVEYIIAAEQKKPAIYKTIQDMFWGSVISTVLYTNDPSKINEFKAKKFENCEVFLDTNFIFNTLVLNGTQNIAPTRELFDLLKKYDFSLKVFGFTVDEICRVMNGYISQGHKYPSSISVDTLYSSLKRQGWSKTMVREFITIIEVILNTHDIEIEWDMKIVSGARYIPHPEVKDILYPGSDIFPTLCVYNLNNKPLIFYIQPFSF
jgi:hypothetical protein